MLASVVSSRDLRYSEPGHGFSPDERYPEYGFSEFSSRPNLVYRALRQNLRAAGLDRENFGTKAWNPLGAYFAPGSSVFVLCNFVYHRRPQESRHDFFAKCVHGSVLRALCDYILLAIGPRGRIRFGNSPLQACRWEQVLEDSHANEVERFYREHAANVESRDLRLFVTERSFLGHVSRVVERGDSDGRQVVLGSESLLSELARDARFRIADYKPERIEGFHSGEV
ncbi:MAG: hypothetical protein MJE66_25715, partial [Proteobacteria bacterium]|nr:hypothetical protein [Pseudomonadota bacterium]